MIFLKTNYVTEGGLHLQFPVEAKFINKNINKILHLVYLRHEGKWFLRHGTSCKFFLCFTAKLQIICVLIYIQSYIKK